MKMRKKLAALLAAAMIASVMPMTAFAASTNKVTKTVTVKKDEQIKVAAVPELKVEVKDELPTNQSFYLHLTGAKWASVDVDDTTEDLLGALANFNNKKVKYSSDAEKIVYFEVKDKEDEIFVFQAYREGDKTIAIKNLGKGLVGDVDLDKEIIPGADQDYLGTIVFPMLAKVTDSEAFVEVDKFDTEISDSKHTFAVSDAAKAKVVVGTVPNLYRSGKIADITLEERYASSIAEVKTQERWFTLELRDSDFTFQIDTDSAKIVGERAYRGAEEKLDSGNYALSKDNTKLAVKISNDMIKGKSSLQRGNFKLEGVKVVADKDAKMGEIQAVIDGEFLDKETIIIANRGDYKTKLDVPKDWKYDVVAGTEKEVEFTLTEELANSLVGRRPVTFTFDQGVKISAGSTSAKEWNKWVDDIEEFLYSSPNSSSKTKLEKDLEDIIKDTNLSPTDKEIALYKLLLRIEDVRPSTSKSTIKGDIEVKGSDVDSADKDEWSKKEPNLIETRVHVSNDRSSFTVDEFKTDSAKAGKYTFKVKVLVPANVTGDITVAATGKGITEDKIVVLKAEAPAEVAATTMDIKVGLKEIQTTGKITIKETKEDRFAQGKDIVLRVDDIDSGLKIKSFKATVVEGDLVLNDKNDPYGKWSDKAIGVKRSSTKLSTIEITDIVMSTDRTVPEGKYDLLVGGDAISRITKRVELSKDDNYDIDPVAVVKDFINITTKNTEDISGSSNKAEVSFVVGSTQYLVNGKAETMDAVPYVKDGRTMVPVRYVAAALGITGDKVVWDGGTNQTATILADKVIQVKLGSKTMVVNGANVPMSAAAELKDGRVCVPVAEIARALGVTVEWNEATKTATFNPKN